MKLVIDIEGQPKKNDILIFDGNAFKPIDKDSAVAELSHRIKVLEDDFAKVTQNVDRKLEEYHNILQLLTKGEVGK